MLRTALFWVITQGVVVIFADVSGQPICPIFRGKEFLIHEDGTEMLSRKSVKF